MTGKTDIWVMKGYETFALLGEKGLVIEQLSKEVGISKSSFYHHFADLEIFIDTLLLYHLERAAIIAEKERKATRIKPDLIHILLEHKTDLLFNRQLRIKANNSNFNAILIKSTRIIGNDFIKLWANDAKISLTAMQLEGLFELAMQNFFLQINHDNLNKEWLEQYFDNLNRIAQNFDTAGVR